MDYPTPTRRPDLELINKRKKLIYSSRPQSEMKEMIDKYLNLARGLEKLFAQSTRAVEYTDCFSAEG